MRAKLSYIIFCLILFILSCNKGKQNSIYPRHVGDISFDEGIDRKAFKLCNGDKEVKQYFNFGKGVQYDGEKLAIIESFKENYKPIKLKSETGLIRIRFIVNCKGETGRFRILSMDSLYKKKEFDKKIIDQLLNITKKLAGWKILSERSKPHDYYQYLIFKIENGDIKEILP